MISSNIEFIVDKCDNATKKEYEPPCASPEEINRYIYDLEVNTWAVQRQMDFSNYKDYPPIDYDNIVQS